MIPGRSFVARLQGLVARRAVVYGINRRNVELVYAHNERRDYPVADDKLLCKEHLGAAGVPVPDTLVACEGLFAIPKAIETLANEEHFVVKPANGGGGRGILVVAEHVDRDAWRRAGGQVLSMLDLHRHLADIIFGVYARGELEDRAFVERRIIPHELFRELWIDGLCDVRVITLKGAPIISMIRVPTASSGGRANLHQGGLGLAIDLDTGRVFRAFSRGHAITRHPDSGRALLGIEVPSWEGILDVAGRAGRAVPLGYLGVDVVVDQDRGPLVLEINARPGLEIQNVNGFGLGAALTRRFVW